MTNKLTTLQYALMNLIAHAEHNTTNGSTPTTHTDVNTWLWADEFAKDLSLTGKQVGGLLTTLETAGMIGMQKVKKSRSLAGGVPDESTVWFTEAGFEAWLSEHNAIKNINAGRIKPVTKKKAAKKAVAAKTETETKKEEVKAEPTTLDLLASREGSHKRLAAETLLKNDGKEITMADLAKAVYGEPEFTGQIGMVLKGIAKAIEVQGLALTLTREKGSVKLSSLEEKKTLADRIRTEKVKKVPASKKAGDKGPELLVKALSPKGRKKSIADFLPNNSEESINIRSKRSRKAA
jgi:hypothetical protein